MISQAFATPPAAPIPHLLAAECSRLEMLALDHEHLNPDVSALLLAELERAILHEADTLPPATVTMHAEVEYLDEADVARGRISILTPVAAGLIGLTIGDRIAWPDRQGRNHMLRIMRVTPAGMEGSSCRSG